METYDIEIFRSKVGVKYFELMETIKGLDLIQLASLTKVLKRMGVEFKINTISSGTRINISDDIDEGFFDDIIGRGIIDFD